jgi:hypothetical protein
MGGGTPSATAHPQIHDGYSKQGVHPHSGWLCPSDTTHYDHGESLGTITACFTWHEDLLLHDILYGCEIRSLTVNEENKL